MDPKKNIYVIYASQNKEMAHHLIRRWQLMEKDFNVSIWYDNPIYPEREWKLKDTSRLDQADIFLFLVSHAFMYSPFIQQDEFKTVIDKYKAGESVVIPVLLDLCPWDVDFNSDDYNFSFKELQVLPEDRKPITAWDSKDEAIKHVSEEVEKIIFPSTGNKKEEETPEGPETKAATAVGDEQVAMNFTEESEIKSKAEEKKKTKEEAKSKKKGGEALKRKEEAEAKERVAEEKRVEEEAEAEKIALEEKRLKQEAESKEKAEKDLKLKEEAEAKKRVEEEKRVKQEAESKKKDEKELKLKEEAEAKRKRDNDLKRKEEAEDKERIEKEKVKKETEAKRIALEEKKRKEKAEAERKKKEALRLKEEIEDKKLAQEESAEWKEINEPEHFEEPESSIEETSQGNKGLKKKALIGIAAAALALMVIWNFNSTPENPDSPVPETENTDLSGASTPEELEAESNNTDTPPSKLEIGGRHEGGIIFALAESGTSGTIASYDDEGPMTWNDAINIHEKLGEGWRLPTLDELKIMRKTIGQGANNDGEFSNGLYWSATPYDEYQARLLRFRDGNTSYHYNKAVETRRFRVRAIRDFSR